VSVSQPFGFDTKVFLKRIAANRYVTAPIADELAYSRGGSPVAGACHHKPSTCDAGADYQPAPINHFFFLSGR